MHEERERELEAARTRAIENEAARERSAKEWQEELKALEARRAGMDDEEL